MKTLLHLIVFVLFIGSAVAGSAFEKAYELNRSAEAYVLSGDLNQAINTYEDAVQVDPSYGTAYINLVKTYFQLEDFQSVVEMAKNALAVIPHSADLFYFLGTAYLNLGIKDKGQEAINMAMNLNPKIKVDEFEKIVVNDTDTNSETLIMSKK